MAKQRQEHQIGSICVELVTEVNEPVFAGKGTIGNAVDNLLTSLQLESKEDGDARPPRVRKVSVELCEGEY